MLDVAAAVRPDGAEGGAARVHVAVSVTCVPSLCVPVATTVFVPVCHGMFWNTKVSLPLDAPGTGAPFTVSDTAGVFEYTLSEVVAAGSVAKRLSVM